MKLIYCPYCSDVVRLHKHKRQCECKKIWGMYIDDLNATISKRAILIGFSNNSFIDALKSKPNTEKGTKFEAFVIDKNSSTIKIEK
jgi:hypothetical protein